MDNLEFKLGWPPVTEKKVPSNQWSQVGDTINDSNQDDSQSDTGFTGAIEYLEKNKIWHKDSLNKFSETQGLYDELNDFQYNSVSNRYSEKLSSSHNLEKIVNALSENQNRNYNPHSGKEKFQGKYNGDSDKEISIDNYIKWLSIQHDPDVAKPVDNHPKVTTKPQKSNITGKPISPVTGTKNETSEQPKSSRGGVK